MKIFGMEFGGGNPNQPPSVEKKIDNKKPTGPVSIDAYRQVETAETESGQVPDSSSATVAGSKETENSRKAAA